MRILSGIQPSGTLHLGNYFGSILPNKKRIGMGDKSLYMIVDLHALTTVHDPVQLRSFCSDAILDLLACGFDADDVILFFQSHVKEHAELSWILSTITPMGLLERAVSYKDKVQKGISASVGLFTYPVLMAADILLYDATLVPVGKDQKQHVEMARDIAVKFNTLYGETFVLPEPLIQEEVAVVPGTDGQKMSKSYNNTIPLFGDEAAIKKAIMSIKTDSLDVSAPKNPDTCSVYQIHKLFLSSTEAEALAEKYKAGGVGYGDAKKMLFETYMDAFSEMRQKRASLQQNTSLLSEIAERGAKKARLVAGQTMERVRKAVGL